MTLLRKWRSRRGQSLVEFALILPILLFLVLGMVEMGFAINHNTSIVTATRQGARVGSELVNGSLVHHCSDATGAATVDAQIIASTEGVLRSPGSPINILQVTKITIFEVTAAGVATGKKNDWVLSVDAGNNPTGTYVPGTTQNMYFIAQGAGTYPASTRCGTAPAPGIGVAVTYTYKFITPLGAIVASLSSGQILMSDQTIMALEPPLP
jgi:Flp pilus assembly protein TadG